MPVFARCAKCGVFGEIVFDGTRWLCSQCGAVYAEAAPPPVQPDYGVF